MKKLVTAPGILLLSILLFLLVPEFIDWISTARFQITMKDIRIAVFMGIFTPVVFYFSKRIRNDKTFVVVMVLTVVVLVSLISLLR